LAQKRELAKAIRALGVSAEEAFARAHRAEAGYAAKLRMVARMVAAIIDAHAPPEGYEWTPGGLASLEKALSDYSAAITPWAKSAAWTMLVEVNRRNKAAWATHAREMSQALRAELASAPIGEAVQGLLAEQVDLITSLPTEAAQHVHSLSLEALETAQRYPERQDEIQAMLQAEHPARTKRWLRNRATLIARTETARAASVLTQARSEHIGATHYQWLTAGDARVRESHRRLNHKVFAWATPPLSDPPDHYSHPGQIWNCRCIALPVL
jgi:SPP1 gp7 family putative phage head morphogenesis protein